MANVASAEGSLTQEMDIFSLGCVIAEIFLEGASIFTLAQLFKYKKGEYKPPLGDIEDESIRSLVMSMISLDPAERLSADEYLNQWTDKAFPKYFEFLHEYIENISRPLQSVGNTERARHVESDQRIEMIWKNYRRISRELGLVVDDSELDGPGHVRSGNEEKGEKNGYIRGEYGDVDLTFTSTVGGDVIPVCLDLPGMDNWIPKKKKTLPGDHDDGALIVVAVVCSAIRNTLRSSSKIKACDLLLALGEQIHDEAKLDRCLPYLMSLLDDTSDNVQVAALRSLTQLLTLVGAITPINDKIFPEYIFPRLTLLLQDRSSVVVRAAYAACLPTLAQIASRFLDMGQILQTTGIMSEKDPDIENGAVITEDDRKRAYDVIKQDLSLVIEEHARSLLTDHNPDIRRALLRHIVPLCLFLGRQKTNDVILSHAITYLNDSDAQLRMQLFDSVVGIAPYVGSVSLKEYVTPLMMQSLTDSEELVVNKVVQAFTALAGLGLLEMSYIWELLRACAKFMVHPNNWIRNSTFCLFASSTRWMSPAQIYSMLWPILQPFMEGDINDFSVASLSIHAKPPLPREIYNLTATWATKAQKSIFWKTEASHNKSTKRDKTIDLSNEKNRSSKPKNLRATAEDEQWLTRLRVIGMKESQLWMLALYKEYIFRVFRSRSRRVDERHSPTGGDNTSPFIKMQDLGILPQNVFFDTTPIDDGFSDLLSSSAIKGRINSKTSSPVFVDEHFEATRLLAADVDETDSAGGSGRLGGSNSDSKWRELIMAHPVTGTVFTDVYGELDSQLRDSQLLDGGSGITPSKETLKYSSYTGDDPYIWRMLGSVYKDSVTFESPEFGPRCSPYTGSMKPENITKKRKGKMGILAANYEEHAGPVNAIAVAPDHSFFVTGSDDGTVKIWDSFRLEKNVINRAAKTVHFKAEQEKPNQVKCICFIENTYSLACGTTDGSVNLIRVETVNQSSSLSGPRYKPVVKLNGFKLNSGEYAIALSHGQTSSSSLLYVLTTDSRIVVFDLIAKKQVAVMENPSSHGIPTCFVLDKHKNWVLVGTSRGILDLWDTRFQVHIRSWGIPGGQPINSLSLYMNPKAEGKWVCVSGGTKECEITVWDIETVQCREIYRTTPQLSSHRHRHGESSSRREPTPTANYSPVDVDKSMVNGNNNGPPTLSILLSQLKLQTDQEEQRHNDDTQTERPSQHDEPPRADSILSLSSGYSIDHTATGPNRRGYLLSGGTDRIVRFWDLNALDHSTIISGIKAEATYQPSYVLSYPEPNTRLVTERLVSSVSSSSSQSHKSSSSKKPSKSDRPPRSTIIACEQLDLSRNHQSSVLAVALLLKPFEMVVSADRLGTIKVYI
ncbi:ubiquitin-binding serine/threonine protein kinase VPS15 [Sugiyamaella lignohabitans]|uniref:non-specific serine/threonine protein kinase n=1 Tax=Sugiyamaella lignohabitans TaxID=796027 RepID=A0A167CVY0_9ASCO|nr:ubiquitin-binding serine/threonine protein kinase VPS15 [Sugiyamaella lignohabitans]ANB12169.1 ubiquitin-binding serine/threonine protein kinase VPS15 [Sugiyamaella lignohabitans]